MNFDIAHEGRATLAVDYVGALDLGYPAAIAGAALKSAATQAVGAAADGYRAQLAGAGAIKVAGEYWVKSQIAADPVNAEQAELDLIDREAAARGVDRTTLLADISGKAAAFRQVALLVGAVEAEAKAAITAIPDAATDIEAQIDAALAAARDGLAAGAADAMLKLNSV